MIARAPYLFLLLILIPDLYLDRHYWRHRMTLGKRFVYWLPSIILVAYTIALTYEKNFIPEGVFVVLSKTNEFMDGADQFDDITMLCVKYNGNTGNL